MLPVLIADVVGPPGALLDRSELVLILVLPPLLPRLLTRLLLLPLSPIPLSPCVLCLETGLVRDGVMEDANEVEVEGV